MIDFTGTYREYLNMISINISPINLRSSSVSRFGGGAVFVADSFSFEFASKVGFCMNSPKSVVA